MNIPRNSCPGLLRVVILSACVPAAFCAEGAWPVPALAERYVRAAFERNLALQARDLDVAQERARLERANGARQPRLDLQARYSRADGGRTIDVPSGDLINPVYRTLNELLVAQGRPAAFPTVSNLAIPLLREREQDTRLRLTAPLYTPELGQWSASRRAAVDAARWQQAAFRRDLRLGVLSAYYNCLRARSAELILIGATESTAEALRVSRALFDAEKVTEDRVLRAEADDLSVRQQLADAARDRALALHAFNVLLHRPLDTPIEVPDDAELAAVASTLLALAVPPAVVPDTREELAALKAASTQAEAAEAAIRARTRPTVALVVEGGIQGESYRTGSGANYAQASLVGEFNLWDGHQRRSELDLARAQRRQIELQLEVTREQLAREAQAATVELVAARTALPAAQRRTDAAARAFQLVAARNREGMSNQLAFLDARQAHTTALLNLEMSRQRLLIAAARIDRALATSAPD